jgi:hypothetical protein
MLLNKFIWIISVLAQTLLHMHRVQPSLGLYDRQRRPRRRHLLQGRLQRKVRDEGIRIRAGGRNSHVGKESS